MVTLKFKKKEMIFSIEEEEVIFDDISPEEIEKIKEKKDYLEECGKNTYRLINFFTEKKKVPDAWRYVIKKEKKDFTLNPPPKDYERLTEENKFGDVKTIEIPADTANIVLVLESPHKEEYNKKFDPLGPAQGATGQHMERYLGKDILPEIEKIMKTSLEGEYNLVICNPLQYQTSLYQLHKKPLTYKAAKKLRDTVWKSLFEQEDLKEDFKKRLLLLKPEIIINGCTSSLSPAVQVFLENDFSEKAKKEYISYVYIFKTPHPSSWYFGSNRRVKYS